MNSLSSSPVSVQAIATTKQEILDILLKQGRANALSLSQALQISPQAIRRHLKDLEADGLVVGAEGIKEIEKELGRPQHFYQLSPQGRDLLPKSYDRFALDLLSSLLTNLDQDQAAQILGEQWQNKGIQYRHQLGEDSLPTRLTNLANLRRMEGYVTEWQKVTESENQKAGFIFTEYNCAIAQIAASHPNVCSHELEMFSIALPDCEVERTHWMIEGEHRCGYLIKPKV
jgi:DeoR family transcriptional regulator, suf operon transcriptional repressor